MSAPGSQLIIIIFAVIAVVLIIGALCYQESDDANEMSHSHHHVQPCSNKTTIAANGSKKIHGKTPVVTEVKVNTAPSIPYDSTYSISLNRQFNHPFDPRMEINPDNKNIVISMHNIQRKSLSVVGAAFDRTIKAVEVYRSMDGGKTFSYITDVTVNTDEYHSTHFSIGYGPYNRGQRLYFVSHTIIMNLVDPIRGVLPRGGVVCTCYSDDNGTTWSPNVRVDAQALNMTSPSGSAGQPSGGTTVGLTVDTEKHSPNYGMVAVGYHGGSILADGRTHYYGSKIAYSRDFGVSWQGIELDGGIPANLLPLVPAGEFIVPNLSRPTDVIPAFSPDGDLYCLTEQAVYTGPDAQGDFNTVTTALLVGPQIQRIKIRPTGVQKFSPVIINNSYYNWNGAPNGTFATASQFYPSRAHGVTVDQKTGTIYVYYSVVLNGNPSPSAVIELLKSTDHGLTWTQIPLTPLPGQSCFRPTLVISPNGRNFILRFTTYNDVPAGTPVSANLVTMGAYYMYSNNGGNSFSVPLPVSATRYSFNASGMFPSFPINNGVGLTLNGTTKFSDNNTAFTVWGDARNGIPTPLPNNGPTVADFEQQMKFARTDVYGAKIDFVGADDNSENGSSSNNNVHSGSAATKAQVLERLKLRFDSEACL